MLGAIVSVTLLSLVITDEFSFVTVFKVGPLDINLIFLMVCNRCILIATFTPSIALL